MGEISEALRRARGDDPARKAQAAEPRPIDPGRPASPAPPPTPAGERIESPPRTREGIWSPRALFVEDHGPAAESARHLALRLRAELERRRARSVAVVSALHSEGKTTVAGNLAFALCSLTPGRSVALIDCDLRRPTLAKALGIDVRVGIDDVIAGDAALADARISFDTPPLDVYLVRKPRAAAHELLVRPSLDATIRELERLYTHVVFDTAPILLVPDTPILLERLSACVAVARAGHSRTKAFHRMCELVPAGKMVGAVLDEGRLPAAAESYRYYEQ
ncbi:MAG: hypothetical protein DCC71_09280 [Proteobacteria bacterium]|nr:MAG: hypothetical protein DCC71_09280 [Pseudomonadota bacterium]